MSLFRNLFFTALFAGVLAGLALTAIQHMTTVPLILQAETYETAAPAADGHEHSHDETAWAPQDGFERIAFTALANVLSSVGFALILVAVSELRGGMGSWREGLLWGLAGFAVFTLAPSLGLPPELPTMPAAPLDQRQLWWLLTVALTAGGLSLMVFSRNMLIAAAGLLLIAVPHMVGAPMPDSFDSVLPAALEHRFIAAVVVSSFVFWVLAGALAGYMRPHLNAA
jgi:cobalt transporter subunit CbtA